MVPWWHSRSCTLQVQRRPLLKQCVQGKHLALRGKMYQAARWPSAPSGYCWWERAHGRRIYMYRMFLGHRKSIQQPLSFSPCAPWKTFLKVESSQPLDESLACNGISWKSTVPSSSILISFQEQSLQTSIFFPPSIPFSLCVSTAALAPGISRAPGHPPKAYLQVYPLRGWQ